MKGEREDEEGSRRTQEFTHIAAIIRGKGGVRTINLCRNVRGPVLCFDDVY